MQGDAPGAGESCCRRCVPRQQHSRVATVRAHASQLDPLAEPNPKGAAFLRRLPLLSVQALPQTRVNGELAFTRRSGGCWYLRPLGASPRYAAITQLGLLYLPERSQREVLGGDLNRELVGRPSKRLDEETGLGDVAPLCWRRPRLGTANCRLRCSDVLRLTGAMRAVRDRRRCTRYDARRRPRTDASPG